MRQPTASILGILILAAGGAAVGGPAARAQEETEREFCAQCHEETVDAFTAGPHGQAMAAVSQEILDRSCATCHGPVETHLEEFTAESIERWPKPAACLECHPNAAGALAKSTPGHARNAVACLDCHGPGHAEPPAAPLLLGEPRTLCGGCHADVKAAFSQPYSHREGSETFECTTCHAVHGGGEAGRFAFLGNGGVCITCHSDKAGPFVFPHPPREVDGCVGCHEPHGTSNPRQLTRRTVLNLCLECHADVPVRSFHDFTQARFRRCQTCHRAVHGSNSEARLFDE